MDVQSVRELAFQGRPAPRPGHRVIDEFHIRKAGPQEPPSHPASPYHRPSPAPQNTRANQGKEVDEEKQSPKVRPIDLAHGVIPKPSQEGKEQHTKPKTNQGRGNQGYPGLPLKGRQKGHNQGKQQREDRAGPEGREVKPPNPHRAPVPQPNTGRTILTEKPPHSYPPDWTHPV